MAKGTWQIEKYTGGNWVDDGLIYRNNEPFEINLTSTQMKSKLANGGNAFMTPEVVYNTEPLMFTWLEVSYDDAFITKIKTYIQNHDYLRITDHLGNQYLGTFTTLQRVWLVSEDNMFDLKATFEVQV